MVGFFCIFFFVKQKTAYEIMPSLVGSEMCIRDRPAATANAKNTGTAALSVSFVNATQPTTGNYTLSFNGSAYTLTDNQTGAVVGSAANLSNPIDGLNFSMTGTMNPGDSFSVSPTS